MAIVDGSGTYVGTEKDIPKQFNLTHQLNNIFQRTINSEDSSIVNVLEDTITIPNHYFITGERLTYTVLGVGSTQAIGIASTSFVGVGTTDKLPSTIYTIKVNDNKIKLARSAEDALKAIPKYLNITAVGIGSIHKLTATNQNARALISINNIIQSPIVSTAITSTLVESSEKYAPTIKISGITSFFAGDLIKVNDEIMKINIVGLGSTNILLVDRPWMGSNTYYHPSGSLVRKYQGNYNIVDNKVNFAEAPTGPTPFSSTTNPPNERDWVGISSSYTFHGRVFLRSGVVNGTDEPYTKNYVFDDISNGFNGTTDTFILTSNQENISGFHNDNAIVLVGGVFQQPEGGYGLSDNYKINESVGISNIEFIGNDVTAQSDVNTSNIPVGGIIVSIGSTAGFGYQPLVSAGGTAIVSIAGTISSISIGNSGSGYRPGIQTSINVGVRKNDDISDEIKFIGTATVSNGHIIGVAITNPGIGYTNTNPPSVIFDVPLSYSNIPLVYSSSSVPGNGIGAKVDIIVGSDSSVVELNITNFGYGYDSQQILTVNSGGVSGIPTDSTKPFSEFRVIVDRTYESGFSAWSVGQLELLDVLTDQFNGYTRTFGITVNTVPISILSPVGSNIDIKSTLLVFLNDTLQIPGDAYTFDGGSTITFSEAPKVGETSKIFFYKGTAGIDVIFTDILETIKIGDTIQLNNDPGIGQGISLLEDGRIVTQIKSTDSIKTNVYSGFGITSDENTTRPLEWRRQLVDMVIDGKHIGKDRVKYEPQIIPTTYIIKTLGVGSTEVFVQNIRPLFNSINENTTAKLRESIIIISQDEKISAAATAIVSVAGTVSSINITNGGKGYVTAPTVTVSYPIGIGSTYVASAQSSISSGIVTAINIINPGSGYTSINTPHILISPPTIVYEKINEVTYSGDYGTIVGVKTTSVGVASTGIIFDLFIPMNSDLRNQSITGVTTISGIQTGYYFSTFNTNIGNGVTSLYQDSSVLGISTQYLDNVYEVASVSIAQTNVSGIGIGYVSRVIVSVSNYNSLTGIGDSSNFGEYSWGRVSFKYVTNTNEFNAYPKNGISGLSTSSVIKRTNPLKYTEYLS